MAKKSAAASTVSVVTGEAATLCRPFTTEFRLSPPESGFRIAVVVEKACTQNAEATFKLVFDLFKKVDKEFVEIVHVSFKADAPVERQGIEIIASDGVPSKSASVLRKEVFPVARKLEGREPTADERALLKAGMSKAAVTAVEI